MKHSLKLGDAMGAPKDISSITFISGFSIAMQRDFSPPANTRYQIVETC